MTEDKIYEVHGEFNYLRTKKPFNEADRKFCTTRSEVLTIVEGYSEEKIERGLHMLERDGVVTSSRRDDGEIVYSFHRDKWLKWLSRARRRR